MLNLMIRNDSHVTELKYHDLFMTAESRKIFSSYKITFPIAFLLMLLAVVLILIPDENVIGAGVKYVYLHVALVFTGTLGFALMGITGIIVLILNREAVLNLVISLGWVSASAYALSILISMISASIMWGSVSFTEPYMVMSIQVLLAAMVVQISFLLIPWLKLKAVMSLVPVIFLIWMTNTTKMVLHPASPIRDSTSSIIKISFIAVFIPCLLLSGILVYHIHEYIKRKTALDLSHDIEGV